MIEEIKAMIQGLPNGKALGSDGPATEFYKLYTDFLAPQLLSIFNEGFNNGSPPSLMEAILIVILKPDNVWKLATCTDPVTNYL